MFIDQIKTIHCLFVLAFAGARENINKIRRRRPQTNKKKRIHLVLKQKGKTTIHKSKKKTTNKNKIKYSNTQSDEMRNSYRMSRF